MDSMNGFKAVLFVMLFYSISISILTNYALPAEAINHVDSFSDFQGTTVEIENVTAEVQNSLDRQTNIPVIEVGALVFYSGNIIIDLILNFTFAIPEMIGFLVYGITSLFNLNPVLIVIVQGFASSALIIMYFLGIIQMLTNVRSGRLV